MIETAICAKNRSAKQGYQLILILYVRMRMSEWVSVERTWVVQRVPKSERERENVNRENEKDGTERNEIIREEEEKEGNKAS